MFNKKKTKLEITSAKENRIKANLKIESDRVKNDKILKKICNEYINIEREKLINAINKAAEEGYTRLNFSIDNYFNSDLMNDEAAALIYLQLKKEFDANGYTMLNHSNRPDKQFLIKW